MVKFIPHENYVAIKTPCKSISKDFASNIRTEITVSFHKVWPLNKLKGFNVFSVIRLKDEVDFLIVKFLEVFYILSALVIVAKSFEKGLLRNLFSEHVCVSSSWKLNL